MKLGVLRGSRVDQTITPLEFQILKFSSILGQISIKGPGCGDPKSDTLQNGTNLTLNPTFSDLPSSGVSVLLDYLYLGRARLSLENGLSALEVSRRLNMRGRVRQSRLFFQKLSQNFLIFEAYFSKVRIRKLIIRITLFKN